jgi:hypothetical protein
VVRAMRAHATCPALLWFGTLTSEESGRVRAAMVVADRSRRSGRPAPEGNGSVRGSSLGLVAVVALARSRRETHLIVLGVWGEEAFWAAGGCEGRRRRPEAHQVADADRVADEWTRRRGRNP